MIDSVKSKNNTVNMTQEYLRELKFERDSSKSKKVMILKKMKKYI